MKNRKVFETGDRTDHLKGQKQRKDKTGEPPGFIAHVSFITTYQKSTDELKVTATDIRGELGYEGEVERQGRGAQAGAISRTTMASTRAVTAAAGKRRRRPTATRKAAWGDDSEKVVKTSR
ncbi:hypothetical protein PHMEG_0006034 [Phytophthora megakarya]|uniref:Uncharacterized protein n=1 Tax=Phytophthora megakarya TaxID=4795 RepID=A0A225WPQ7_9STRA|nr:hypothetical protein PHMEG_0006034 [Phytophthora megakarya]